MAAPVYRTSTITSWSSGDGTIAVPSGTVDGDLLILAVGGDMSASEDHTYTVSGFNTLLADTRSHASNAGVDLHILYRIASSEPANYTIDIDSNNLTGAMMVRIDGHDGSDPFDASTILGFDNSTEPIIPTITTTVAECLIIGFTSWDQSKTLTSIPPSTNAINHVDVSGYDLHGIWFEKATAGATGNQQYDVSSAAPHVGAAVAIQPPQGGTTTSTSSSTSTSVSTSSTSSSISTSSTSSSISTSSTSTSISTSTSASTSQSTSISTSSTSISVSTSSTSTSVSTSISVSTSTSMSASTSSTSTSTSVSTSSTSTSVSTSISTSTTTTIITTTSTSSTSTSVSTSTSSTSSSTSTSQSTSTSSTSTSYSTSSTSSSTSTSTTIMDVNVTPRVTMRPFYIRANVRTIRPYV